MPTFVPRYKRLRYQKKYRKQRPRNFNKYRRQVVRNVSKYNVPVHYFKRKCKLITLDTNITGYASNTFVFGLNQVAGYTEFQNMFDQYSIRYVKLYIVHRATDVSMYSVGNDTYGMPNIVAVRDYDDGGIPPASEVGYDELREYSKAKTFSFTPENRVFSIGLVPAIRSELYQSAVTSTYSPKFKQYIDMSTASTPHYGVKVVIQMPTTSINAAKSYYDCYATFYLGMKNVR